MMSSYAQIYAQYTKIIQIKFSLRQMPYTIKYIE